jgi:hypothetical protein
MRKRTTKSSTEASGDIQRDSAGLESGLGDLRPGDDDEAVLENEDIVCQTTDEFKTMINRWKINFGKKIIELFPINSIFLFKDLIFFSWWN